MDNDLGRVAATLCILSVSAFVLYTGCTRSSTIYFFELDSSTVFFLELTHAVFFPLVLSCILYALYKSGRRVERLRKLEESKSEQTMTRVSSRKVSRCGDLQKILESDESSSLAVRNLKRMLSDVDETESLQSEDAEKSSSQNSNPEEPSPTVEEEDGEAPRSDSAQKDEATETSDAPTPVFHLDTGSGPPSRSVSIEADPVEIKRELDKVIERRSCSRLNAVAAASGINTFVTSSDSDEGSRPHSRSSSFGSRNQLVERSRRNSLSEPSSCDIYRQLSQVDFVNYMLGALNMIPKEIVYSSKKQQYGLADIFAEIIGTHVPIWLCVAAFNVTFLEVLNIKCAYYFYYHEEIMIYSALAVSLALGFVHEYTPNYVTNNILALSSIYVAVARLQTASYQAAFALVIGMAIFDLFWLYVIDVLSTVTKESKAPLMILIPRDNQGHKQRLSTLDIIVPGLYLNIILKYSSMYDPALFMNNFYTVYAALLMTMGVAIYRSKITPAMVLPAVALLACSLLTAAHPNDLWRFMIKH